MKTNKPYDLDILIMDEQNKTPWKVWAFVIGLNVVGLLGAMYLQSKGINVFAIRGGSWFNETITVSLEQRDHFL